LPSPPPSHRIPVSYSDQRSHKINYVFQLQLFNSVHTVTVSVFTEKSIVRSSLIPKTPTIFNTGLMQFILMGVKTFLSNLTQILCKTLRQSIISIKIRDYRLKIRGYPVQYHSFLQYVDFNRDQIIITSDFVTGVMLTVLDLSEYKGIYSLLWIILFYPVLIDFPFCTVASDSVSLKDAYCIFYFIVYNT
jgi:hypothetical protein